MPRTLRPHPADLYYVTDWHVGLKVASAHRQPITARMRRRTTMRAEARRVLLVLGVIAAFTAVSVAGEASKAPTAQITDPPRTVQQLGYQRTSVQDSTLAGGSAYGGSNSSVPINACMIDSTQPGCPDYCTSNPSMPGCGGSTIPPPTCPAGTSWNGSLCVPGGGSPDPGWCGVPAGWGPDGDPGCSRVTGGWRCHRSGSGTIYYVCP